jgi:hypothetical protein
VLRVNGGRRPYTLKKARRFSDGSLSRDAVPQKLQKSKLVFACLGGTRNHKPPEKSRLHFCSPFGFLQRGVTLDPLPVKLKFSGNNSAATSIMVVVRQACLVFGRNRPMFRFSRGTRRRAKPCQVFHPSTLRH